MAPPTQSTRALQPESSDAVGVAGLVGFVGLMGLCCGVLPLVLAGVISAGAVAAGLPWLGLAWAILAGVGLAVQRRRRRQSARARGP